jgi:hypothetical protein
VIEFIKSHARWLVVVAFAMAMAWLESATVYYLRTLVDRIEPYQPNPLPIQGTLGQVELVREGATLVMLLTVGILAGRTWRARWGYAAVAFGVWDIFYYIFLRPMSGWPRSILDWDVLFLLPLPWWGPVLAPVSIAVLMIVWGTIVTRPQAGIQPSRHRASAWCASAAGIALALYVFMADALQQVEGLKNGEAFVLPTNFNWPIFCVALLLMAAPLAATGSDGGHTGVKQESDPSLTLV